MKSNSIEPGPDCGDGPRPGRGTAPGDAGIADEIQFDGAQFRRDIGAKTL
ncbi:MAG: hypothetical protein ACYDH9_24385 [Limisphaerales bacterium]